jgi:hypothetical protein
VTNEEIVELGMYCEGLLQQEPFRILVEQYELNCFQHFVSTAAHEQKKRDGIYAQFNGLKDFLGMIANVVDAKNKIERALSSDAPDEDID